MFLVERELGARSAVRNSVSAAYAPREQGSGDFLSYLVLVLPKKCIHKVRTTNPPTPPSSREGWVGW